MLEEVRARGIICYLASGTDEPYVWDEARALQITKYFAGIYGALEDWKSYSKRQVIERIIRENRLRGEDFASFGDGFVEIEETKAVGGVAIGVASNEATRTGIDEWKRERLIEAGADLIVPDFLEHKLLSAYLFAEDQDMKGGNNALP
jgi:phosphoglycolate phosphatase-like HAD superfamily hydrolase